METISIPVDTTERWWNSLREYQAAEWLAQHKMDLTLADCSWYQLDHLEQDAIRQAHAREVTK